MENKLDQAKKAFENNDLDLGTTLINQLLEEDSSNLDALMLKAKMYYQKQKLGDSINTLSKVLEIAPNHLPALHFRQMINSILNYWNKDNYNP